MASSNIFFSVLLMLAGAAYLGYTLFYLFKGQIRTPSIWDKKPLSFKKKPTLAILATIVQIILSLFFLILGGTLFFNG